MRRLRLYILAIVAVCAVACGEEAKKVVTPEFDTFEYELIEEGNYAFSISYERIKNAADSRALQIIDSMNYHSTFGPYALEEPDLQRSSEALVNEALTSMQAFNSTGMECEMHIYQVASLVRNNSIVCYDTVIETNFGGIYPIVNHTYECYDIASGNIYDFSYLNEGEWYEALTENMYNKLKAEYGAQFYITAPQYLHLPNATYLTDSGIVFQYQTYEIGDAELGSISVEVTDAELKTMGAPLVWK